MGALGDDGITSVDCCGASACDNNGGTSDFRGAGTSDSSRGTCDHGSTSVICGDSTSNDNRGTCDHASTSDCGSTGTSDNNGSTCIDRDASNDHGGTCSIHDGSAYGNHIWHRLADNLRRRTGGRGPLLQVGHQQGRWYHEERVQQIPVISFC